MTQKLSLLFFNIFIRNIGITDPGKHTKSTYVGMQKIPLRTHKNAEHNDLR